MEEVLKKKTGTTTIGIICKDCAILGSESKATMGWLVASKTAQKIYPVDDKIALTTAGGSGDTQTVIRMLKAEINLYKLSRNTEFTVKATATLLANILSNNRYYPYMAYLLIGGCDKTGCHVYSLDAVGGVEEEKCTATGSGSPMAYGVLEDGYRENMTREEGIRIVARSIRAARERDVFSGGRDIVIVVIDKNGMEFVDKEKIKEIVK